MSLKSMISEKFLWNTFNDDDKKWFRGENLFAKTMYLVENKHGLYLRLSFVEERITFYEK